MPNIVNVPRVPAATAAPASGAFPAVHSHTDPRPEMKPYVDGTKLCDEDTDLGLDWALSRLLTRGPAIQEAKP